MESPISRDSWATRYTNDRNGAHVFDTETKLPKLKGKLEKQRWHGKTKV